MAVLLHRRTTTRGVDHYRINLRPLEELDDAARHRSRLFFQPGMHHQRPAARLTRRHDDLATFGGKYARRGSIDVREEDLLHASAQHTHTSALVTHRNRKRRHFAGKVRGPPEAAPPSPPIASGAALAARTIAPAPACPIVDIETSERPAPAIAPGVEKSQTAVCERASRPRNAGCYALPARACLRSACRTARPMGTQSCRPCIRGSCPYAGEMSGPAELRPGPPSASCRCARAASPSLRPIVHMLDKQADKIRSARSRPATPYPARDAHQNSRVSPARSR